MSGRRVVRNRRLGLDKKMSIHSHVTSLCLWGAQPALQAAVAAIMWRRKLNKQFPLFFSFVVAQVAIFALTYPLYCYASYKWYFWAYWSGEAFNAILSFKVIHEIFLDVFRPYHSLRDLGTPVFKWAGVVMLLVSVVIAASNTYTQDPVTHAVTALERSVRMVQVGLILFLILFSRFLGVSRRQYSFGISLGFGVFAGTELMLLALTEGQIIHPGNYNLIYMLAYNASILVWLTYSVLPIVTRDVSMNQLQTQRWERGLADLQPAAAVNDSLIPMFEGMVERAFSKSSNLQSANEPLRLPKPATQVRTRAAAAVSSGGRRQPA